MNKKKPTAYATPAAYAAIDLGTSNCRMLIARPSRHGLQIVNSFSRIVRLGEGLANNARLGDNAISRTIDALKICSEKIHEEKATRIHAIATEACRRAANGKEFIKHVKAETGLVIETISTRKEAELTLAGCVPLMDIGGDNRQFALIIDIGGGSTELMWIELNKRKAPRLIGVKSIPWGVVTLAERYGSDTISPGDYSEMMQLANASLLDFNVKYSIVDEVSRDNVHMLGTSGTVTMLGGLYLNLQRYRRDQVDGLEMDSEKILKITSRLAAMSCAQRAAIPCIGHQRAELTVGGCAFIEAALRYLQVRHLRAADRGIREGLLLAMMANDGVSPTDTINQP